MNVDYLSNDLIKNEISILLNHDTISDSMLLCKKVKEKTGIPLITLHHGQIYLPYSSLFSIVCIKQGFNIRKALFPLYYLYVLVRECLHHKRIYGYVMPMLFYPQAFNASSVQVLKYRLLEILCLIPHFLI